eukprot:2391892-Rhodomonas_salina.1
MAEVAAYMSDTKRMRECAHLSLRLLLRGLRVCERDWGAECPGMWETSTFHPAALSRDLHVHPPHHHRREKDKHDGDVPLPVVSALPSTGTRV